MEVVQVTQQHEPGDFVPLPDRIIGGAREALAVMMDSTPAVRRSVVVGVVGLETRPGQP